MKRKLVVTALLSVFTNSAAAQELISARTDSLIRKGIRLSIEQSYEQAQAVFSRLKNEMPENPAGYFFLAAALHAQMMDYEVYDRELEFYTLIKTTIELSRRHLKKHRQDAWGYFFLGGGYGYLAFYQAKQKKFIEAFQNGHRSIRALEMAINADSTLYDAYLGLGNFKYYRSKFSRYFAWLPFVGDERAEGIQLIRTAITKSRYSRYSARNSFGWIALEEGNYETGWQTIDEAVKEFPQSRVFLWCAAKLAARLERWSEAIGFYQKILNSLKAEGVLSPYNELICRKNLHQLYIQIKEYERAREECAQVHQIAFGKEQQKRCQPILREIEVSCQQFAVVPSTHVHSTMD